MSDFFRVSLEDSEFQRFATNFPRAIYNATRSAHRSTATFIEKQTENKLSEKYEIPLKTLKKYRVTSKKHDFFSSVTTGWNPIAAKSSSDNSFIGKLSQEDGGAWAGSYYFENGFISTLRSGRKAIFKRVGNTRLPIKAQTINVNESPSIVNDMENLAGIEFKRRFESKMQQYIQRGIVIDDRE
jgi:hypothetical protein